MHCKWQHCYGGNAGGSCRRLLYLLVCLQDKDGVIWPWDTARGFRDIGYNPLISGLAPFFIHTGMSLPTQVGTGRGTCGGAALV